MHQYRDREGKIVVVDDPAKIPPEYRGKQRVHKERYDHLPEEDRQRMREAERRELETLREEEERQREALRQKEEEEEAARREEEERVRLQKRREEERAARTTPVTIRGNTILVPVTLSHGAEEVEVVLILDTGADFVCLHESAAGRLRIEDSDTEAVRVEVAGGRTLKAKAARIDAIRVGGVEQEDVVVVILPYSGRGRGYDGLLGMNFLRKVGYSIDYRRQVILWSP